MVTHRSYDVFLSDSQLDAGVLDKLLRALNRRSPALSAPERQVLAQVYRNIDAPLDRLLSDTELLERLTDQFNKQAHTELAGERLAQELVRLRKSGDLPRVRETVTPILT